MSDVQFPPQSARPPTRETYQRKAQAWSLLCSQLDDYAIAGNARGISRVLNRLHGSVSALRREKITIDSRDRVRRAWRKSGLTQSALAAEVGVSYRALQSWMRNPATDRSARTPRERDIKRAEQIAAARGESPAPGDGVRTASSAHPRDSGC